MKSPLRLLLCGGIAGLLGAWLFRSPEPAAAPRARVTAAPPGAPEPAPEPRPGDDAKAGVWASDEMQVVLAPGAALPAESVFTRAGNEAGVKIPPAADRAAFAALAREMERRPGVKQARPVFYASRDALEKRSLAGRKILTRQVAATLPEGASPEAAAARAGARVLAKLDFLERTWLFEAAGPFDALEVAAALKEREGAGYAAPQFARQQSRRDEPLFPQQWHLQNTGQIDGTPAEPGEDIQVVPAWASVLGEGVVVGIVDDGLEGTHEDLAANYAAALGIDINDGDGDPIPTDTQDRHGTACAGLAAARGDNGLGGAGAAPRATLAGIRLIAAPTTDAQEAQAMAHQNQAIHVKSNSWGPPDADTDLRAIGGLTLAAIADGAATGRGGRGVVYVWAGGNGRSFFDNSNLDSYANQRHAIAVGGLDHLGLQTSYSEPGANLLVCAPAGYGSIRTTDLMGALGASVGNYRSNFDGTSASSPIVAGVVALVLNRNPELKARDVMHVLARTARQNDAGDAGWTTNAAGFTVNHKYGHGAVDAAAAVDLAGRWPYAGALVSRTASSGGLSVAIDEFPAPAKTHALEITGSPMRVEHVEIDFSATHEFRGDIEVVLVSPSNTRSVMTPGRPNDSDDTIGFNAWRMMSVRHWGEMGAGTWTLEVRDTADVDVGTFTGWTIRVYGTAVDTTAPVAGAVNDGPAADVDAHPSLDTVTANWSGFADPESGLVFEWAIGTTAGGEQVAPFAPVGYATSASRSGLSLAGGTPYFVTVRATNFDGLSTTATSDGFTVDSLPPDPPSNLTVAPSASATGAFTLAWGTPFDPGDSGVASYTVLRSKDGGPLTELAAGITSTTYNADISADGPGGFSFQVKAVDAAGNVGGLSAAAAAVYDPIPPSVVIDAPPPGAPLSLSGTALDNVDVVAVSWVNAATGQGGVASGASNWTASVPLAPGTNAITVFGWDALGNVGTQTVAVVFTPSDVLPPSLTISVPTAGDGFTTGTTPLALGGAVFDNTGVTSLAWENVTTGTRGTISVAAFWSASVPLLAGTNLVVVTARDAAGNETFDALTVAFTPAADATPPGVVIAGPDAVPAGASPFALGGTASDNAALALVRWSNAATGGGATASGLGTWNASVALAPGPNVITVTAVDAAGNEATDVVTVTFTPPGGDTVPPAVDILIPSADATTGSGSVVLAGLASDNDAALEVVWSNAATGESGTAAGVGAWSAVVPLEPGANAITVRVFDSRGNSRAETVTVTLAIPGSGGSGGCGATGLEALLLALWARRGGRGCPRPSPRRGGRHGPRRPAPRSRGPGG